MCTRKHALVLIHEYMCTGSTHNLRSLVGPGADSFIDSIKTEPRLVSYRLRVPFVLRVRVSFVLLVRVSVVLLVRVVSYCRYTSYRQYRVSSYYLYGVWRYAVLTTACDAMWLREPGTDIVVWFYQGAYACATQNPVLTKGMVIPGRYKYRLVMRSGWRCVSAYAHAYAISDPDLAHGAISPYV